MFNTQYDSENRKFCLFITVECPGTKKIRVWAEDFGKRNSKYADREIEVNGKRTIFFSFPITPRKLFIGALNCQDTKDANFTVTLMEGPLKTYNIYKDSDTEMFLPLALHFSQICGFTDAPSSGRLFTNGDFNIRYFDVIRKDGQPINTPARIGHSTGIIEVAKVKFDNYTVAMRMMILLHEFSHKYKNPKIGLNISNEIGADINALYIYLGMGFSKIDAICVFAKVFLKAQTKGNIERMRKINDYIRRFEQQEFAELN